jgi:hypothetical protein
MGSSNDIALAQIDHFKQKFSISPKTATLLIQCGFTQYSDVRNATVNQILHTFEKLPGIKSHAQAEGYRRAMRGIVWLATLQEPETHEKDCKQWTNKGLRERGLWSDEFDDLTGNEIAERIDVLKK